MNPPRLSRRHFLRTTAAGLAGAPWVTTGLRAASPNGKLRHASFGAAGMAWADISSFASHPRFELVAVCDVDTRHFAQVKQQFPAARCYQDWREMLAKEADGLDSVNVSTPDHVHALQGLAALTLGKHLYGQKPLTQNLFECRQLQLRARRQRVVTQMGTQLASGRGERLAVALIQQGAIGKVREVHTFSDKTWGDMSPIPEREDPVPAELDWNGWLGPAATRPYIDGFYHPGIWRKRRDFGTATLGDMGCHIFSGWFRALELAAPLSVKSSGPAPANATNWPVDARIEYSFKGTRHTAGQTITVTWYDGSQRPPAEAVAIAGGRLPGQGSLYLGTEGAMIAPHGALPVLLPREKFKDHRMPEAEERNHWHDFIDACLAGKPDTIARFDIAGPLTEAVLLGCLAFPFPGETLRWDAAALRVPGHEAATKLVRRAYREGWEPEWLPVV